MNHEQSRAKNADQQKYTDAVGSPKECQPMGGPRRILSRSQEAEIMAVREKRSETRRATVSAIEDILYEPIPVLDHGFVRVVDYMGDDTSIVQAARVSYGQGTKKVSNDRGLIRYLMRHRHTTPFEMCEIKIHAKLPIFVARQWVRHRTANINEYSARYSILDKEFYIPDESLLRYSKAQRAAEKSQAMGQVDMFGVPIEPEVSDIAPQSKTNKQGREGTLERDEARDILNLIKSESARAYTNYLKLLNEDEHGRIREEGKSGLARELARMVLPVNYYTQWYWKIDLHNLLHFIALRADPHAQYEIRAYANVLAHIVQGWVPLTWEAFQDYRLGSAELSTPALGVVRRLLAGEDVRQEESGLSKREWAELMATLGRDG